MKLRGGLQLKSWALLIAIFSINGAKSIAVYDASGKYSDILPSVKTINLHEVGECKAARQIYQEPKEERVQILKKVEETTLDILHCKVVVSLDSASCGFDGLYSYIYDSIPIAHDRVERING